MVEGNVSLVNTENLLILKKAGELFDEFQSKTHPKERSDATPLQSYLSSHIDEIVLNFEDTESKHLFQDVPPLLYVFLLYIAVTDLTLPQNRFNKRKVKNFDTLMDLSTEDHWAWFISTAWNDIQESAQDDILVGIESRTGQPYEWLKALHPFVGDGARN